MLRWSHRKVPYMWVGVRGKSVPRIGFGHLHSFHWRHTNPLVAKMILEWKMHMAELQRPRG